MFADYQSIAPESRVWIYQADRQLSENEAMQANTYLRKFAEDWKAHQQPVKGFAAIYHNAFVVFMADESYSSVSGCSIDSSVAVVRDMEQQFGIDFFNRLNLAYLSGGIVKLVHRNDISALLSEGKISDETKVFNNLVSTKADFERSWMIPFSESWAASLV